MQKSLLIAFILFITLFMSCKKNEPIIPKPSASFTTELGYYGVTVFTGTATEATSYKYDFGDGTTATTLRASHIYTANGNYTVTLTATGNGGVTTTSNGIRVTTVTGNLVVWMQFTSYQVAVTIDGNQTGDITGYYSTGKPDCGSQSCANFSLLNEGTHTITAKEKGRIIPKTWSGTLEIVGGLCSKIQIQ